MLDLYEKLWWVLRLAAASTVEAVVGEVGVDDPGDVEVAVPGAAVTFSLLIGSIVPLKGKIMLVEAVTASEAAAALEVEVASDTAAASEAQLLQLYVEQLLNGFAHVLPDSCVWELDGKFPLMRSQMRISLM